MSCLFGLSGGSTKLRLFGTSLSSYVQQRNISVTPNLLGKRNFRKFFLGNKRGTKLFRKAQARGELEDLVPLYTEVKEVGFFYDGVYHHVPEMRPEIIVPDLSECELKPYVSYRVADIYQSEFTAQDLFDVVYRHKIVNDYKENKLDEHGNPLEPSEAEKLTPEEAWIQARKTGCDIFSERIPKLWECLEKDIVKDKTPQIQISADDLMHPSERKKPQAQDESVPPQMSKVASMNAD